MITHVFRLIRPHHYVKNLFVFLPLFFAGQIHNLELLLSATLTFISFCLISSSVYVFNDIMDRFEDKNHPVNKLRPIASGKIKISIAYLLDIILTSIAFIIAYLVDMNVLYVIVGYKVLNILYSIGLKRVPIFDVMILAVGFVLRLYAGSAATGIMLTEWIIIMTFLLSMLLALGKRRNDVLYLEEEGVMLRSSIRHYNSLYLNFSMIILSSVVIVAYILYTLDQETIARVGSNKLYITSFWVIAGILRYLQILFVTKSKMNPVLLLVYDHPLKIILFAWIINFLLFIYLV